MIAAVLSAVVFAAIFSAYIFMARNLTRMANFQQQQVQDRRAFAVVAKDVNEASQITTAQAASLVLTIPPAPPGIPGITIVTYTFDAAAHTLTRQALTGTGGSSSVVLSNLTSFTFNYFTQAGDPGLGNNIKQIEMSYNSAVGDSANGTQANDSVVSARIVMRNKPAFGQ